MTGARLSRRSGALAAGLPGAVRCQLVLAVAAVMLAGAEPVWAQTARPSITVAATLTFEPATQAPLAIGIGPSHAVAPGYFLRVHGLPSTAALSGGHSIAPGAWAVPVSALPTLKIVLPAEATGRSEVSISLVTADGTVLTTAKVTLIVVAPPAAASAPAQSEVALSPPEPKRPALSGEARERALRLVKRGDEQLAEGGIAQARLLYERAADAGLALGAMAMAATYDAVELQRLGVRGLKPDDAAARRWYERALLLGAPEAAQRLQRLGQK